VRHDIKAQDLKSILHSKRANIYYLEYCRVLVNGGRVEYVTERGKESLYWNIPIDAKRKTAIPSVHLPNSLPA
jgi:hypothetical protein